MIVTSISLIEKNEVIDVNQLFLSKLDALNNIVGLAPDTRNTLAKLGEAINNDSNFYQSLTTDLPFKANTLDTYRKTETYSEAEVNYMMNQSLTRFKLRDSIKNQHRRNLPTRHDRYQRRKLKSRHDFEVSLKMQQGRSLQHHRSE